MRDFEVCLLKFYCLLGTVEIDIVGVDDKAHYDGDDEGDDHAVE